MAVADRHIMAMCPAPEVTQSNCFVFHNETHMDSDSHGQIGFAWCFISNWQQWLLLQPLEILPWLWHCLPGGQRDSTCSPLLTL